MSVCNAVITGANKGIGLELCRQLLAAVGGSSTESNNNNNSNPQQTRIFAACRRSSAELDQLSAEHAPKVKILDGISVTDDAAGAALQAALSQSVDDDDDSSNNSNLVPIHLLIHNAGAYGPPEDYLKNDDPDGLYETQTLPNITAERLRFSYNLNAVAPLMLTQALLPNLRLAAASSGNSRNEIAAVKVVIISSLMGSIADNASGGHYGYRAAKAAANMVGRSLACDLRGDRIAVGLVHPGFVYTNFGGTGVAPRPGQHHVDDSARGVLQAVDRISLETTGRFWHGNYGDGPRELSW